MNKREKYDTWLLYLPSFKNTNNVDFFADKDLINANLDDFLDGISEVSKEDTDRSFLKETIAGKLMHQHSETSILDSNEMAVEYVYENLRKGKILEEA